MNQEQIQNAVPSSIENLEVDLDKVDLTPVFILSKIHRGGFLTITGYDILELSRAATIGEIRTSNLRPLLHSNLYSLYELSSILEQSGFKILTKQIVGHKYIIEAQRA